MLNWRRRIDGLRERESIDFYHWPVGAFFFFADWRGFAGPSSPCFRRRFPHLEPKVDDDAIVIMIGEKVNNVAKRRRDPID